MVRLKNVLPKNIMLGLELVFYILIGNNLFRKILYIHMCSLSPFFSLSCPLSTLLLRNHIHLREKLCNTEYKILDKIREGRHQIEKDLCEGTWADSGNMWPVGQVREKKGTYGGKNNYGS